MTGTRYGTLGYERARAIKIVEDIGLSHGLRQGGEQYPNGLAVADCGMMLAHAVRKAEGVPDAERLACEALAEGLMDVYRKGGVAIDGVNGEPAGVPYERLVALADEAMSTGVPPWTP